MKLKRSIIRIIATSFFVCAMYLSTFSGSNEVSLKRAAPLNAIASDAELHDSTVANSVSSETPAITFLTHGLGGYALNYQGTEGVPISPGFIGDHNNYVWYHRNDRYCTIEVIEELVAADAAPRSENAPETLSENGFVFSLLDNKYSTPSEDAYRVALAFDLREDYNDYHWYRQNPDGTWSHKPSNGEVRDFDFDGNPILDPEFCNRKSNPLIDKEKQGIFKYDYSSLTYYFEVDGFYLGV